MRARTIVPAAVFVAVAAVWLCRGEVTAPIVPAEVGPAHSYLLDWRASEQREGVSLDEAAVTNTLVLSGKLVLQDEGGGAWLARVEEVKTFSLSMLGSELPVTANTVQVPFRFEREGERVVRVQFPEGAEPLAEHLLQALALELGMQTSRLGEVEVQLTPRGDGTLERRRTAYRPSAQLAGLDLSAQRVTSRAQVKLDGSRLVRLEAHERLELAGAVFDDVLVVDELGEAARVAAADVRWSPARPANEVSVRTDLDRRLLEQRAEGFSSEQLIDDLKKLGNGGRMPNHDRWLWQAVGRLRLQPETAAELERTFLDGDANTTRRMLIMDLLASAGTKDAQAAMLRLLDSEVVAKMPEAGLLQQRLSFVTKPEPETTRWLESRFERTQGEHRAAAAASLGAAAGHLAADGKTAEATRLNARLTSSLEAAKDGEARETLLAALGNAGLPQNRELLERSLHAAEHGERRAALLALRKDESPEATSAIIGAASDAELGADALRLLTQRDLAPSERTRVLEQVRAGTSLSGDLAALNLLSRDVGRDPSVDELLLLIAARHPDDTSLRAHVYSMLAQAPAAR